MSYVRSSGPRQPAACKSLSDKKGDIYHTYSTCERGIDLMNTTYNFLDLTAKGRDENPDATQDWVRYHDQYSCALKEVACA